MSKSSQANRNLSFEHNLNRVQFLQLAHVCDNEIDSAQITSVRKVGLTMYESLSLGSGHRKVSVVRINRLDYQPLFGKMSPHSSRGGSQTGPGRRRKSSLPY